MDPHWPSVIVVCLFVLVVAVVHFGLTALLVRLVVRRTIIEEMGQAVRAVNNVKSVSDIYLSAVEQHTSLTANLEAQRKASEEKRLAEVANFTRVIVRQELDKRLKQATETVVSKVEQVPSATASLVATEAVRVAAEKLASDSNEGTLPSPKTPPK